MFSQKANLQTEQIIYHNVFQEATGLVKNYVGRACIWRSKTSGKANAFAQKEHIFSIKSNFLFFLII